MIRGLYTATSGMIAQQQKMDVVSNNLANVNTTGFKKDGVVMEAFEDVLTKSINVTDRVGEQTIGSMTLGAKVGSVYTDFTQGAVNLTNDPLNVAIDGEGMISIGIMDANGNISERYTRDGSFNLGQDGTLLTKDGHYVLGEQGKIVLPNGNLRISEEGKLFINNEYIDTIKLTNFENPDSLRKIGDSLYKSTEETVQKKFESQLLQGYIEGSNVNTVKEMVDMISVMRTYETNQKVLQTQDETLGKAVNDIGRL